MYIYTFILKKGKNVFYKLYLKITNRLFIS